MTTFTWEGVGGSAHHSLANKMTSYRKFPLSSVTHRLAPPPLITDETHILLKVCCSVMSSLGVEAEFTWNAATSNQAQALRFLSGRKMVLLKIFKKKLYMWQSCSKRTGAVGLNDQSAVEDADLSAGREVNCAFTGWAVHQATWTCC